VTQRSRFVPGIYNYCDRWCERCPFDDRCLVHHQSKRAHRRGELPADDPESLLKYLHKQLRTTVQVLRGTARHRQIEPGGLDWPDVSPSASLPTDADRTTVAGRFEPLVLAAHVYTVMVDSWMDDEADWLAARRSTLRGRAAVSAKPGRFAAAARDLHESLATILWDRTLIPAKLARAMSAPARESELPDDAQGSAKVALLSMDRSSRCWETIRVLRSPSDGAIAALVAHLDTLRRDTERRFPGARTFKRPGFDDAERAHHHKRSGSGRGTPSR
jgi:hypothetical protein